MNLTLASGALSRTGRVSPVARAARLVSSYELPLATIFVSWKSQAIHLPAYSMGTAGWVWISAMNDGSDKNVGLPRNYRPQSLVRQGRTQRAERGGSPDGELPAKEIAQTQLKNDAHCGPGFGAVDFGLAALAVGEDDRGFAEARAAAAEQPEDLFLERIAARTDLIEGQL